MNAPFERFRGMMVTFVTNQDDLALSHRQKGGKHELAQQKLRLRSADSREYAQPTSFRQTSCVQEPWVF